MSGPYTAGVLFQPGRHGRLVCWPVEMEVIVAVGAGVPSGQNLTFGTHGYNGSYRPSSCHSR